MTDTDVQAQTEPQIVTPDGVMSVAEANAQGEAPEGSEGPGEGSPAKPKVVQDVTYASPDNLVVVDTPVHVRSTGRTSPFKAIMEKIKENRQFWNKPVFLAVYGRPDSATSTASQKRKEYLGTGFTFDTADHEKGYQLVVIYDPKLDEEAVKAKEAERAEKQQAKAS